MSTHVFFDHGQLDPHPANRKVKMEGEKWEQLKASLKEHGVIADLLVRPMPDGRHQIIAGERRWRGMGQVAPKKRLPCKILNLTDREALELILIDNLEREDLDAEEEALGVKALIEQAAMTPEEVAKRLKRSLEWVKTRQLLLDLPLEAIEAVKRPKDDDRRLTMGVVQLLLDLDPADRVKAVQLVLHPQLQPMPLREAQAKDVIQKFIVEPQRGKMVWEKGREKLAKEWRARLKKLLPKTMAGDLVVRALTWEEAQQAPKGRSVEEAVPLLDCTPDAPTGLLWLHLAVRHGLTVSIVPDDGQDQSRAIVDTKVIRAGELSWSEPQKRKIGEQDGEAIWETVEPRETWLVSRDGRGKVVVGAADSAESAVISDQKEERGTTNLTKGHESEEEEEDQFPDFLRVRRVQQIIETGIEHPEVLEEKVAAVPVAGTEVVQAWTIDGGPVTALKIWAKREPDLEKEGIPEWVPGWAMLLPYYGMVEVCEWLEGLKR